MAEVTTDDAYTVYQEAFADIKKTAAQLGSENHFGADSVEAYKALTPIEQSALLSSNIEVLQSKITGLDKLEEKLGDDPTKEQMNTLNEAMHFNRNMVESLFAEREKVETQAGLTKSADGQKMDKYEEDVLHTLLLRTDRDPRGKINDGVEGEIGKIAAIMRQEGVQPYRDSDQKEASDYYTGIAFDVAQQSVADNPGDMKKALAAFQRETQDIPVLAQAPATQEFQNGLVALAAAGVNTRAR